MLSDIHVLDGELSFQTVPDLWPPLQARVSSASVELDLAQVTRADSAGLALLMSLLGAAHGAGKTLHFINIPAQVMQLAKVGGVDKLLLKAKSAS